METRTKPTRAVPAWTDARCKNTGEYLKAVWPDIRRTVARGRSTGQIWYAGWAIPKPGGGVRELGIPTVVDRLIQQALLQVLQPLHRSHLQRAQLRLPAGAKRASGGVGGAAARAGWPSGGGGRGSGEVLRPRQPRHPDGSAGQADRGQEFSAASSAHVSWLDRRSALQRGGGPATAGSALGHREIGPPRSRRSDRADPAAPCGYRIRDHPAFASYRNRCICSSGACARSWMSRCGRTRNRTSGSSPTTARRSG